MVTKKVDRQKLIKDFKRAESLVRKWLIKKGFKIIESHKGKNSNKPYDIIAKKRIKGINRIWAIDVKSGKNPQISLINFQKLLENPEIKEKKVNMIAYALVINEKPYLLEYSKWSHFGDKAYKTRIFKLNGGKKK